MNPIPGDALNTYVAAGVAVQSQWYNPVTDSPYSPYVLFKYLFMQGDYNTGLGICQVSNAAMNTPYGEKIEYPNGEKKGVGLGLAGQDQTRPAVAVSAMRRRITVVTEKCPDSKCSSTDIFIAAALAQNGDLTQSTLLYWRLNYSTTPITPNGSKIDWKKFFEGADQEGQHHARFQLKLFYNDAIELRNRGWYLPEIAEAEITEFIQGAYR
jgi:hypothetical protein